CAAARASVSAGGTFVRLGPARRPGLRAPAAGWRPNPAAVDPRRFPPGPREFLLINRPGGAPGGVGVGDPRRPRHRPPPPAPPAGPSRLWPCRRPSTGGSCSLDAEVTARVSPLPAQSLTSGVPFPPGNTRGGQSSRLLPLSFVTASVGSGSARSRRAPAHPD